MKTRIKKIRFKLNLTQTEFGRRIGYTYASIQNWEKGKSISVASLKLLENIYYINPDWLRKGEGEMFLSDPDKSSHHYDFQGTVAEIAELLPLLEAKYAHKVLSYVKDQLELQKKVK